MTDRADDIALRVDAVTKFANIVLTRLKPDLSEFTTFLAALNGTLIEAAAQKFETDRNMIVEVVAETTKDAMGLLAKNRGAH